MIDVVFLLLVFFMLASRFGSEGVLEIAGGKWQGAAYDGPPRLVDVAPEGLMLNGREIADDALADALGELVDSPEDTVVLRAQDAADVQRLVAVMQGLHNAGFTGLVLVE